MSIVIEGLLITTFSLYVHVLSVCARLLLLLQVVVLCVLVCKCLKMRGRCDLKEIEAISCTANEHLQTLSIIARKPRVGTKGAVKCTPATVYGSAVTGVCQEIGDPRWNQKIGMIQKMCVLCFSHTLNLLRLLILSLELQAGVR